jgi:hypothetical protein
MSIRLLIDMNLSPEWVAELGRHGFDAVHWSSIGGGIQRGRESLKRFPTPLNDPKSVETRHRNNLMIETEPLRPRSPSFSDREAHH